MPLLPASSSQQQSSEADTGTELLEQGYDFLLKLIIIGESGTGKSCLLHHFLEQDFKDPSPHTIGVSFSSTILRLPSAQSGKERRMKLQLWDTAGQERFRSVTRNYYRGASGAILMYDITNRKSFENLSNWLADARALASPDLAVVLVGSKLDKERERQVDTLEASEWAKNNDVLYVEVSAKTGENVTQPFLLVSRAILFAIESGKLDPEKPGSGVSYGERALRRVGSWGSGLKGLDGGSRKLLSKCC